MNGVLKTFWQFSKRIWTKLLQAKIFQKIVSQLPNLQSRILFCGFFDGAINGLSGLAVIFSSASCMLKMRLCNGILWKTPLHWSSGCHLVSSFVFFSKKEKKKKIGEKQILSFPNIKQIFHTFLFNIRN